MPKSPSPRSPSGLPEARLALALLGLLLLVALGYGRGRPDAVERDAPVASAEGRPVGRKVPLVVHVMSQCPYAIAAENNIHEALASLAPYVDLRLEFIGQERPNGELVSMHGPGEVRGDLAQICAQKHVARWFDLVRCQNEDDDAVDTNWEACATRLGAMTPAYRACVTGEEGRALLAASFAKSRAAGVGGSPNIVIDGKTYSGNRTVRDLGRSLCAALGPTPPEACRAYPIPPPVRAVVLNDRRCPECEADRVVRMLERYIPNPVIRVVDYGDPEGAKLFAALGAQGPSVGLPVAIFDATLDGDPETLREFQPRLRVAGAHRVLQLGGDWDPRCVDPGGCGIASCKASLVCQPEVPRRLDLYLMTHCPFCKKALRDLPRMLDHLDRAKEPVDLRFHFIGDGDAQNLRSMHGMAEVEEDLRTICAFEHFKSERRFLEYTRCRNEEAKDADWHGCAAKAKLDAARLERCATGDEGKKLLAKSFADSAALGIGASPTWVANGRHMFSGIVVTEIKDAYCAHNPGKGCAAPLPEPTQP